MRFLNDPSQGILGKERAGMDNNKKPCIKKWILNLHLYGGLATCWYLLLYGLSSLCFNHPWLVPESRGPVVRWDRSIDLPPLEDDLQLAEAARDRLGLIGWPLPWNLERDTLGNLRFELSRPGKSYQIWVDPARRTARVEAQNTGLRSILHFLHGSTGGIPGSRYLGVWGVYTEITTWFTLFAIFSGVWLWAKQSRRRPILLSVTAISLLGSLSLMAYIYFRG
jgi:hypothetical protein